jgi:galactonate dehydratase
MLALPSWATKANAARLPVNRVARIRTFYPHFTGPIATAGHMQTMMAFPGQVLMEFNLHDRPVPYLPEFLEFRNGKVWPNDRPGLGVTIDEKQLMPIETLTQGASGPTYLRRTGDDT